MAQSLTPTSGRDLGSHLQPQHRGWPSLRSGPCSLSPGAGSSQAAGPSGKRTGLVPSPGSTTFGGLESWSRAGVLCPPPLPSSPGIPPCPPHSLCSSCTDHQILRHPQLPSPSLCTCSSLCLKHCSPHPCTLTPLCIWVSVPISSPREGASWPLSITPQALCPS